MGLIIGDVTLPCKYAETVGLDVDLRSGFVLRHRPARCWTLYRSLSALRHIGDITGHMLEKVAGHLVNYFMLHRPGFASMRH
eukprot:12166333-Heterocapsa_arctica.AAC.1